MNQRPPFPPFDLESARRKVQAAEDAWNSRNPERVSLAYTGISKDALLEQVKSGAGDWELLQWVNRSSPPSRPPHEIRSWSAWMESMPVGDSEDLEWFAAQAKRINPARTDLQTIMDFRLNRIAIR
jgi:hypothetical protein